MRKIPGLSLTVLMTLFYASHAEAHGVVGDRVFPATLAVEDPFAADELMLPQVQYGKMKNEDGMSMKQTMIMGEYSKTITPNLALSIEGAYLNNDSADGTESGFDNIALAAGYQLIKNNAHELAVLGKLDWDIGGTGQDKAGAESFSTFTPSLIIGKGMGDLPDNIRYLKPLAVTGSLGIALPAKNSTLITDEMGDATRETNARVVTWGGSIQYSIPYLQQHVKNIGLKGPAAQLIPLVEFALETPSNGDSSGKTTGTINPGIIWMGTNMQLGLEAVIPVNNDSGSGIGVVGQVHFYLDNMFPSTLGKPLLNR